MKDKLKIKVQVSKIDSVRLITLTAAELFDAWRIVPRLLVMGYAWLCWTIVEWYMNLEPFLIADCDIVATIEACTVDAPTTQHAALVTAVVGGAAAVFGLYTNGGRSWQNEKFKKWDQTQTQITSKINESFHDNEFTNKPWKDEWESNQDWNPNQNLNNSEIDDSDDWNDDDWNDDRFKN